MAMMNPGRRRNMTTRYMMANHLYSAVVLPSILHRGSGIRMKGIGKEEEHDDEVHDGEPPVLRCGVAEYFAQGERDPHEGDWVIEEDAKDVEEEVHEGYLQPLPYRFLPRTRQRGQK